MTYILPRPMTVDQVCRDRYGDESGYVERVLAANPGLSARPAVKPAGTRVDLPEIAQPGESVSVVALWD